MNEQKLTPWFDGSVKPVRPGLYQRKVEDETCWGTWNGRRWNYTSRSKKEALDYDTAESGWQSIPWRGLAEPPKGAA